MMARPGPLACATAPMTMTSSRTRSDVVLAVVLMRSSIAHRLDDGVGQRLWMARRRLAGLEHGRGEHEASETHGSSIGRLERR